MHVVTGAYGFSGSYIARRWIAEGRRVRTLTNSIGRENPFGTAVEAHPFRFDEPDELARSLEGADVLVNTYWVRFDHRDFTHAGAVRNTLRLFEAAKRAGVARVVHVSITNPSVASPLPYFRGKAELEAALRASGLSYAILRPAVLFGDEDILVNNLAWTLRRFPVFGVFGDGSYRVQPIHVDDFAALAVRMADSRENVVVDAIGPETFAYRDLVSVVGRAIGRPRPIVGVPGWLGLATARAIGLFVDDVVLTAEEVTALTQNLLTTASPPAGSTPLSAWVVGHRDRVGRRYASELARRRDRQRSYEGLRER